METFDNITEVDSAYRTILKNYRSILKRLKTEDPSLDAIEDLLEEQSTLMGKIDASTRIDEKYREQAGEELKERLRAIEDLRERIAQEMQEYLDSVEMDIESIDQTTELMDQYQREGESSYHLDRTI